MLENAFQQDEDAANGLNSIVFLLVQYQSIQETSLLAESEDSRYVSGLMESAILNEFDVRWL
jgi:hypothetical protein